MINENNLKTAGWIALACSVLATVIFYILYNEYDLYSHPLVAAMNVVYSALYIHMFIMLKKLLNQYALFHDTDLWITFLIWMNAILATANLIGALDSNVIVGIVSALLMIPMGILYIVFAVKILKCINNLFGYLKVFAYLNFVAGVLMATLFLAITGILVSIGATITLALIFFKAAREHHDPNVVIQTK